MPRPPTGTVTFLFTDIEGSTRLWETHPDDMKRAIARHDQLSREAIERHAGYVFKTVGDAFCAAFARAQDAAAAAAEIRRGLANEAWGKTPLKVRIGLHAGTADEREGDYFGPAVNRSARMMSAGSGGQILVSAAVRELLEGHVLPELSLQDLGTRRLKDLSSPEHIYQLDERGYDSEFPPLKTLDIRPNNLPIQLTTFIGRAKERREVLQALEGFRLVTLTGPGGCGKTRLALECAAAMVDRYADGIWFVDLSQYSDPAMIPGAILAAMGHSDRPGQSLRDELVGRLRHAATLVVMDNCEHLVDSCAELCATLLSQCGDMRVLTTSREPLAVPGEHAYQLAPFAVPMSTGESLTTTRLSQFDAVQLFVERVRAAGAKLELNEETAPYVAEICWRLDGMPLAIELAAAKSRTFTVKDIASKLSDRLALLQGGPRTAPARQQSFRNLVEWSWQLLSAEEQAAFARLSVFPGSFTSGAASVVLEGLGSDVLESLASRSLLRTDVGPEGETRFAMLATVREFGVARMRSAEEVALAKRSLFRWCFSMSEGSASDLYAGDSQGLERRFRILDADLPNIAEALNFGRQNPDLLAETAEMAARLAPYLSSRGMGLVESRVFQSQVLALSANRLHPHTRFYFLFESAVGRLFGGDPAENLRAEEMMKEALSIAESSQWPEEAAMVYSMTSHYRAEVCSDYRDALRLSVKALQVITEAHARTPEARDAAVGPEPASTARRWELTYMQQLAKLLSEVPEEAARKSLEDVRAWLPPIDLSRDPADVGLDLLVSVAERARVEKLVYVTNDTAPLLCGRYLAMADVEKARSTAQSWLEANRAVPSWRDPLIEQTEMLLRVALWAGDREEAGRLADDLCSRKTQAGQETKTTAHREPGCVDLFFGEPPDAEPHFVRFRDDAASVNDRRRLAEANCLLGWCLLEQGRAAEARICIDEAARSVDTGSELETTLEIVFADAQLRLVDTLPAEIHENVLGAHLSALANKHARHSDRRARAALPLGGPWVYPPQLAQWRIEGLYHDSPFALELVRRTLANLTQYHEEHGDTGAFVGRLTDGTRRSVEDTLRELRGSHVLPLRVSESRKESPR